MSTVRTAAGVPRWREAAPIWPRGWIVGVGALPVLELGFLSVRFDSSDLVARGGDLGRLVAATGDLVRAAVPLLAALALVAAARIDRLTAAIEPALHGKRPWIALVAHLTFAGAAMAITAAVFAATAPGPGLLAAWALSALAAAVAWIAALAPPSSASGADLRAQVGGLLGVAGGLGVLAAGAAMVTRAWWQPFGYATLVSVYVLLRAAGYEVGVEPAGFLVGTPRFVAQITPYCSGYQGMGLMLVFLGAYLYLFRDRLRFPRVLWLLPIGMVVAWVLNALRIALLVMIGDAGHREIAVQGFHYHAGTLLFCAAALGLGAWAGSSRTFAIEPAARGEGAWDATTSYVAPFVALLATSLVTGLVSSDGFDAYYGLRVAVACVLLWIFRRPLAGAGWHVSWAGAGIGVAAWAVWIVLGGQWGLGHDFEHALAGLEPATRATWVGLRLLGSVVIVPVVEELAFRGYLARRLTAAEFASVPLDRVTWPALLAAAALFGLMHTHVVAGTAVGVLYGIAARRRGQLGDAVLAHAVTNAMLAATALYAGA